MLLFRPVGLKELELIAESDWSEFPPRLEHQPIFYPVLNFEYAEQIARDWNTKDEVSGYVGFVTRFEVDDEYVSRFEEQVVGAKRLHRELWVPAEELSEFNAHILGPITVDAFYAGEQFQGEIDPEKKVPKAIGPERFAAK